MEKIVEYNIRQANENDIFELVPLCKKFTIEAETNLGFENEKIVQTLRHFIDSDIYFLSVLESNGLVLGFVAGVLTEPMFSRELFASELAWYVDKNARGYKQSIQLIECFEDWAKAKGAKKVYLSALNHLTFDKISSIYKRKGFKISETTFEKEI